MRIERVLVVCSGNTCRSPMAAALLRHYWSESGAGWNLRVESAGTNAFSGSGATEHAITTLRARGVDLSGHRSQGVGQNSLANVDLVLTMTSHHRDIIQSQWPGLASRVFTIGEYIGGKGDIPDPFGGSLQEYEATAITLEQLMKAVVQRIKTQGETNP